MLNVLFVIIGALYSITIKIRLTAAGSAEDHQSSQRGLNLIFEAYQGVVFD